MPQYHRLGENHMMEKPVIVSVRLTDAALRKLQLLAQVYQRSVGELIRDAVGKHVDELTRTEEFKTRALELKRRNEQTLNELLEVSDPMPADAAKVVHTFPRNISGSNLGKLSILDTPRSSDSTSRLVQVEVGQPPVGSTQLGAAASHKPSKGAPKRWFKLTWKQGSDDWSMEGRGSEVLLAWTAAKQPAFITWKNLSTAGMDSYTLKHSAEGRTTIDIPFSKALLRAEAVRDTEDEARRNEMLPVVHV
jgi:hypothetical protein